MKMLLLPLVLVAALATTAALAITTSADIIITVTPATTGQVAGISLSNSATTTGLSTGTPVGTVSVAMTPSVPIFPYGGSNLHLSASGADSGGVCNGTNGAGNGYFQINGAGSDTLATSSTPLTAGNKLICIAGSGSGVMAAGHAFTITVGHLIDAKTVGADCAGHDGSSGNPWTALCIQQAANTAVAGDTLFLAAGNWNLLNTISPVTITIPINLVGAGSGIALGATGNPSGVDGSDLCPSTSITCVKMTGSNSVVSTTGGYIRYTGCSGSGNITVSRIFVDGSTANGGGGNGTVNFNGCVVDNINVNDVRVLGFNNPSVSGEATFGLANGSNNAAIRDSVFATPINPTSPTNYGQSALYDNSSSGLNIQNSYFFMSQPVPIYVDNIAMSGSTVITGADGSGNQFGALPDFGVNGCGIGPGAGCNNGGHNGSYNMSFANNYFQATGTTLGIGVALNDPGTGGAVNNVAYTGNTVVGSYPAIDSCVWHHYDASSGLFTYACHPSVAATGASKGSGTVSFVVPSTSYIAAMTAGFGFVTVGFQTGYNTPGATDPPIPYWVVTTNSCGGGSCTVTAACGGGGSQPACPVSSFTGPLGRFAMTEGTVGMQINGTYQNNCTESSTSTPPGLLFASNNNSIIGTISGVINAAGTGWQDCRLDAGQGGGVLVHDNTVIGFSAQKNYVSAPHLAYVTSDTTVSPVVTGNFCAGGGSAFTQTDSSTCATSGFNSAPTASFTLGPLQYDTVRSISKAPFTATNFTAQYGAVQWLASTSSVTPTSGGQASTGCGGGACSWSYVPPAYMMGATHGNTVYLWTMDKALHISSAASALVP